MNAILKICSFHDVHFVNDCTKGGELPLWERLSWIICIANGNSIKTQKKFKNIHTKDVQNTVEYQEKHVVKYNEIYFHIQIIQSNKNDKSEILSNFFWKEFLTYCFYLMEVNEDVH